MGTWDCWYDRKLRVVEPEIPRIVSLLQPSNSTRVLDVGCGIGRHIIYFAERNIDAYGFDTSETALARAKRSLTELGLSAHLSQGDMFEPFPFESDFFDAVIATRTIHHGYRKDIERGASEIDRVLAKGGLLFIQSPSWSKGDKIENPKAIEAEPRTLLRPEGEEADIPHHFFTEEELLGLFKHYDIVDLHGKTDHYHGWCFLAKKIG